MTKEYEICIMSSFIIYSRHQDNVECMTGMINVYRLFVGKSEGKRPLRRRRYQEGTNDKIDVFSFLVKYGVVSNQ